MNKYKIKIKEIFSKEVTVNAETEEEAFDYIKNILLKSNLLDLGIQDLDAIETKILEKNGEKVLESDIDFDEEDDAELFENETEIELEKCMEMLSNIENGRQELIETLEKLDENINQIYDIIDDCFETEIF